MLCLKFQQNRTINENLTFLSRGRWGEGERERGPHL